MLGKGKVKNKSPKRARERMGSRLQVRDKQSAKLNYAHKKPRLFSQAVEISKRESMKSMKSDKDRVIGRSI